jgi:hypothetical protein
MHLSDLLRRAGAATILLLAAHAHAQGQPQRSGLDDFVRMAASQPAPARGGTRRSGRFPWRTPAPRDR